MTMPSRALPALAAALVTQLIEPSRAGPTLPFPFPVAVSGRMRLATRGPFGAWGTI